MEKRPYGTFRLGRRGRRGRVRHDVRWTRGLAAEMRNRRVNETTQQVGRGSTISVLRPSRNPAKGSNHRGLEVTQKDNGTSVSPVLLNTAIHTLDQDIQCEHEGAFEMNEGETHEDVAGSSANLEQPEPEHSYPDHFTDIEDIEPEESPEDNPSNEELGSAMLASGDINNHENSELLLPAKVLSELRKVCKWQNMLAFLLLNGTGRVSVEQYEAMEVLINIFIKVGLPMEPPLPASSTIRRSIQPILRRWGFVDSEVRTVEVDTSKSGAPRANGGNADGENKASFLVVLPISWTRMDVSFKPTWNILKAAALRITDLDHEPIFSSIESVPMLKNRDDVLDVATKLMPTTLPEDNPRTPLILSDRCDDPVISIHFERTPSFPADALSGMDISQRREGTVLRSACVVSVLVTPVGQEVCQNRSSRKVSRQDLLNGSFTSLRTPTFNLWREGDVCTLLNVSFSGQSIFVLVTQHVRRQGTAQEMELLCIPIYEEPGDHGGVVIEFGAVTRANVSATSVGTSQRISRQLSTDVRMSSFGKLQDGRLFFIDHVLLYSDGFSQYNFKRGSAGGIYALSLNYPVSMRRSRERVRVIALTPPGVSTMEGIRAVIDDIVKSSTEGVEMRNADGETMVLYTNIVAYVADYHETGHALDITGQNGRAPCHLCAFLRYNGHPSTGSRYAFSTVIHSADTCYARMGARTDSVRASHISNDELIDIGLNTPEDAKAKNSPLHELSKKLKEARELTTIPLTTSGVPVVSPRFDPYRSVLVSPDHVLFGVANNALNFAFSVLPSNARKRQVDAMISIALLRNGIGKEAEIFNFNSSSLHSASISTRFASLLISPEIFREVFVNCKRTRETSYDSNSPAMACLQNLTKLRDLISATYWFPSPSVDGFASLTYYNCNGGRAHLRKLELMSEEYVTNLNNVCKKFPEARDHLDKPNVHRVLELYKHSIPAMGHVRHFAELVFETAHQPLKRAMQRSNFRNSHLQSSETSIADDWKRRLQYIMNPEEEGPGYEAERDREIVLLKLMFGRREDVMNTVLSDYELKKQALTILHNHPLKQILNCKPSKLNHTNWLSKWLLPKPHQLKPEDLEMISVLKDTRKLARDFLVKEGVKCMRAYKRAGRVKIFATGKRLRGSKPRDHDILEMDTAVRACIEDEHAQVLTTGDDEDDKELVLRYFVVVVLVNFAEEEDCVYQYIPQSYAVVRRCERTENDLLLIDASSSLQLLPLTDSVRRVGIIHACENDQNHNCFSPFNANNPCAASVLGGNQFYYYDKDRGYPPRMA